MLDRFAAAGGRLVRRSRNAADVAAHVIESRFSEPPFSRDLRPEAVDEMLAGSRPILERVLLENILPFWNQRVVDTRDGGYRLNHDGRGDWLGPAPKRLITQARTVWFYSRMANSSYAEPVHLEIARHGYAYLIGHLWDQDAGGFFWEVDPAGNVTVDEKHLMAQAFGLFALSEFALASGDPQPRAVAEELWDLITTRAHDPVNGGYHEVFTTTWAVPEHSAALGRGAATKTLDTHLHLLEAVTGYSRLAGAGDVGPRLEELIEIMTITTVVERTAGGELYGADWSRVDSPRGNRVSYGHETERIWLVADACEAAGIPNGGLVDLYADIFAAVLSYGYDRDRGGFYAAGPLGRVARNRTKLWWPQAEGLLCCLVLYKLTGDVSYAQCFAHTLDWVTEHQVDWEHGEWHEQVARNGTATGIKAGPWKAPYHNGRAMVACLEGLDLRGEPPHRLGITR